MGGAQLHRREVQAHNSYLQVAQELGLFGLAFFMVLVLALLYALFKLVILHAPVPDRVLYSGFAGVVAGGLVNAFFESWLFSVGNLGAMPFWACAFLVLSVNRTDSHGRPLKQETKKKTGRPA
jgi:O-antigen ligase